jgi:hypothetical protein
MSTTMAIRVKCACGSVLSFREEPLNGRVRGPVACTTCGADATEKANAFIARRTDTEPGLRRTPRARLSWRKRHGKEGPSSSEPHAVNDGAFGKERSVIARPSVGKLILGVLACLGVGTAAMLSWYALARWTGYGFGIVAWGIGGLVGVCARYCVPTGNFKLAGIAAVCAAAAILGGTALTLRRESMRSIEALLPAAYADVRNYAEAALKLGSEEEIRQFIAEHRVGASAGAEVASDPIEAALQRQVLDASWGLHDLLKPGGRQAVHLRELGQSVEPGTITSAQVTAFREQELPVLETFLAGQPSQRQFESALRGKILSRISVQDLMIESFGPYTLLWLFLGVGTAFKLARSRHREY